MKKIKSFFICSFLLITGCNLYSQTFFLVNRETGKKIRPIDDSNGANIVLAPASFTGTYVQWEKVVSSNNFFYLRNKKTGMYFRPTENTNGSPLIQRPSSFSGEFTQWTEVPTNNGYFYLRNRATNNYFRPVSTDDFTEVSSPNGNIIQRPTTYTGNYTQWKMVLVNGNTPPPSPPTTTPNKNNPTFAVGQNPLTSGKKWEKIENLSDEFNNGLLDPNKWDDGPTRKFPWTGKEPSVFLPENTSVEDGKLKIEHTILKSPKLVPGILFGSQRPPLERLYGGGLIRSVNSAEVGTYYEARVQAGHSPFSTAFWVINSRRENTTSGCPRTTELDVLETIGRRSRAYTGNYGFRTNWVSQMHSNILARETTCPSKHPDNTFLQFTTPLGTNRENWQDFHVYGAWVKSANEIQFFLDGRPWGGIKRPSSPFDASKMYIVMSSNLYAWNRGENSNPRDNRIDPQFIVEKNGVRYFDTENDETTKAGRDERSAQFDWVRSWKVVNNTNPKEISTLGTTSNYFQVKVYPNPTKGNDLSLDINTINTDKVDINVYNLLGKIVYSNSIEQIEKGVYNTSIAFTQIPNLEKGLYMLKVSQGNSLKTMKILIN